MDYGDVVVHVFLDEIRRFYEIERLYRDVPDGRVGRRRLRRSAIVVDRTAPSVSLRSRFGAVAQLVERFHGMEEVRGSIPLSSTPRRTPGAGGGCDQSAAVLCGDTGTSRSASRPSRILLLPAW